MVLVTDIDERGRINLSRKDCLPGAPKKEPGEGEGNSSANRPKRRKFNDKRHKP